MPESLREFLKGVPDEVAQELHGWLDSEPNVDVDMITVLVDSHPSLTE